MINRKRFQSVTYRLFLATALLAGMLMTGVTRSQAAAPGTVVPWGETGFGQSSIPAGLSSVTAISDGWAHSLALKSDGTVVVWGCGGGFSNYGQCAVPVGLSNVTAIAASGYHSLALKSNGTVAAWGCGSPYNYGQCAVPVGLSNIRAISAGGWHNLALKSDGTVIAWGRSDFGALNIPAGLGGVTAIAAGGSHSLALKSDGTVVAWGYDGKGQSSIPAGLSSVTAIAAGGWHSLALKSDGTVVVWGCVGVDYGQCSVPAGLSNVTAIAAGHLHSLALKSDGTVVAWGFNSYGQTSVPAGLSHVTAIAGGYYHSLAVVSEDTTPPDITANVVGTLGNNGWYVSNVTVSWSVVEDESPISLQTGCDSTTLSTDTVGTTLTCSASSAGGMTSQSVTVKLDKTAPMVDAGPAVSILKGGTYTRTGTFSDPSAAPWTATVDYGDGSGVQSLALMGNTSTLNHVYTAAGIFTVEVTVTDDAGNVGTATVEVRVLTPREGTEGLIDQVQALIPESLNDGQGNALIAKLDGVIKQLEKGKTNTAINELQAFINAVNADISSGMLTLEEGQPLIDAANAIIAALES